jgi:hypothetical protein
MNKFNFINILEKEITISAEDKDVKDINILLDRIEIPKIQRDYAQGRDSAKQVRDKFLNAIFNSISNDEPMEMDFVYGAIDKDSKVFTPLDGQQRLTTLFLLYWYIGTRELGTNERENLYKSLNKFTYETRRSSSRFCVNICIALPEKIISFKDKPSEEISNLHWFFRLFKQDPTIKSMLNMLDAINDKYNEAKNKPLFSKLGNLQFYILSLNNFNLTDELYVKMNARGKQLTGFENFKADLIKWMKEEDNLYKDDFNKVIKFKNREMKYYDSISLKIDTEWTYFFWQFTKYYNIKETYKDGEKKGNLVYTDGKIVDPLFIKLFYRYFLQSFILSSDIDNDKMEKENAYTELNAEEKYQKFEVFEEILMKINLVKDFEYFMDKLQNNWKDIENSITPSWNGNENNNKWTFIKENITQKDRVVFLALLLFLQQKRDFENGLFKQWMRVVWNIVENTDINNAVSMIGAMKLIKELSQHAYEIYAFLANEREVIGSTSSTIAIKEEREKSFFIINNPKKNWEDEFISAEQHQFFKGSISFIITDNMSLEKFRHSKEMAFKVFNEKGVNEEYQKNGHIFLRALISRYETSDIIGKNFTDTDEEGHYFKKMLASDDVVRGATKKWFSLENEEELNNTLIKSVKEDSKIQDNVLERIRIKRAHEALYKVPKLQNWMQKTGSIRFNWRGWHLYISKPRARLNWIMLDTYRNEVIEFLLKKGFEIEADSQAGEPGKKIPYFKGYAVEVFGSINGNDYKLTFDDDKTLKIDKKKANEWKEIKSYDYVKEDVGLIKILEREILS